jgi:hypothetical protein
LRFLLGLLRMVAGSAARLFGVRGALPTSAGEGVTTSLEQPAADWTALATDAELAAMPSTGRSAQ